MSVSMYRRTDILGRQCHHRISLQVSQIFVDGLVVARYAVAVEDEDCFCHFDAQSFAELMWSVLSRHLH